MLPTPDHSFDLPNFDGSTFMDPAFVQQYTLAWDNLLNPDPLNSFSDAPAPEPVFDPSHPFNMDNDTLAPAPYDYYDFYQPSFDDAYMDAYFAQQQVLARDSFPDAQFFDIQVDSAPEPAFDPFHPFNIDNNTLATPPIPHQGFALAPEPMFYQGIPDVGSGWPTLGGATSLIPPVDQEVVAPGEINFPQGALGSQAQLPTPESLPHPPAIIQPQLVLVPQELPVVQPGPIPSLSQFAFTFQAPRPQPAPSAFAESEAAEAKAKLILFRLNQKHNPQVRERYFGSALKRFSKLGLEQGKPEEYQAVLNEGIPIYILLSEDWDTAFGLLGDAAFSIFRRKELEKAQSMGTTLPDLKPELAEYLDRYPPCEEIGLCFRELQGDDEEDF